MEPWILDATTESRLSGLERFLERYLGPRQPEFGEPLENLRLIEMPEPLLRFYRFAGRWPGQNPDCPYVNRFCMQDSLCSIQAQKWAAPLQVLDGHLVFVVENQGVWVAATEPAGTDPPVWVSEESSHRDPVLAWRRLEKPLSHFLVSFVLQEILFECALSTVPGALARLQAAGVPIHPVWIDGQYVFEDARPSFFLAGERIFVRHNPAEPDGEEWYGSSSPGDAELLRSLGLPTEAD